MMNYIWMALIVLSFFAALAKGRMNELSGAVISGGTDAVTLALKLLGMLCFWNGLMAITEESGLTKKICKLLSPFFRLLFPTLQDEAARSAIAMNITANLLGLGSAATPFGLTAMHRLKECGRLTDTASDTMVRFVVINSAALHLVPTTVALLRQEAGSASPMEVLLPSVVTSLTALTGGVLMTVLLGRLFSPANARKGADKQHAKLDRFHFAGTGGIRHGIRRTEGHQDI